MFSKSPMLPRPGAFSRTPRRVICGVAAFVRLLILGTQAIILMRKAEQRSAVAAIERLGGRVGWRWNGTVERIDGLCDADINDDDLAVLENFRDVAVLSLGSERITDAGLSHVRALSHLRSLDLAGTSVSDTGVSKLTCLAELRVLGLTGTNVTDACIPHLRQFPNLSDLYIVITQITPEGAELLRKELKGTNVHYCKRLALRLGRKR